VLEAFDRRHALRGDNRRPLAAGVVDQLG